MSAKFVSAGLFFIFIFSSGYWLSRLGKPYQTGIFTIHKLIGLAAGIFLIITVSQTHKVTPLNKLEITILVVTVLIFIGVVAAGALLSIEAKGELNNASPSLLVMIGIIHNTLPYLAVLTTGTTLYLLLIRKTQ
jgi:hypothetical protein